MIATAAGIAIMFWLAGLCALFVLIHVAAKNWLNGRW